MSVLLLRLIAPMQSWGVQSRFEVRDTAREPSKSAVIGLICAALGKPRQSDLTDLTSLRMGVRVDREGKIAMDYHIAQNVLKASGGMKNSQPSHRYYLADAAFLVGLEGDHHTIKGIDQAFKQPHWQLFLGRKAFVPSQPIWLSNGLMQDKGLEQALNEFPLIISPRSNEKFYSLRTMIESKDGEVIRQDAPISFIKREFTIRKIHMDYIQVPEKVLEEV